MTTLAMIWLTATTGGLVAWLTILFAKRESGNAGVAALMLALFAGFTAVQIRQEGVIGFYTNHTRDLTGVQVWWDLIQCTMIALFFIVPRARRVGMNVMPWALLVGTTASIGLLAMCARLFWLERQSGEQAAA